MSRNMSGISVGGYRGTYYIIDERNLDGKKYFLLESEQHGEDAPALLVNEDNVPICQTWEGFEDEEFLDYLQGKCKEENQ